MAKRTSDPFGVKEYLTKSYPGIENECVGYKVVRSKDGQLTLELTLVVNENNMEEANG